MTYHNKLLLKKCMKLLGIILGIVIILCLLLLLFFSKYLIFSENGVTFSFDDSTSLEATHNSQVTAAPASPVLITGSSISATSNSSENSDTALSSEDIDGLMLSYSELSDDQTVYGVDLSSSTYNTLLLEMRDSGSEIISTPAVLDLISRAKSNGIHLLALLSCLDDSTYALENPTDALALSGGALWMNSEGNYYLNPSSSAVQEHIISLIGSLYTMGFEEIVLEQFEYPSSESIATDLGENTAEEIVQSAFNTIKDRVKSKCTLGLLITNPDNGHQAYDCADHLYVYFDSGTTIKSYKDNHPDNYIVFLTGSRDTRFDDYGKILTSVIYDSSSAEINTTSDTTDPAEEPEAIATDE